jgi:hypothetical protein
MHQNTFGVRPQQGSKRGRYCLYVSVLLIALLSGCLGWFLASRTTSKTAAKPQESFLGIQRQPISLGPVPGFADALSSFKADASGFNQQSGFVTLLLNSEGTEVQDVDFSTEDPMTVQNEEENPDDVPYQYFIFNSPLAADEPSVHSVHSGVHKWARLPKSVSGAMNVANPNVEFGYGYVVQLTYIAAYDIGNFEPATSEYSKKLLVFPFGRVTADVPTPLIYSKFSWSLSETRRLAVQYWCRTNNGEFAYFVHTGSPNPGVYAEGSPLFYLAEFDDNSDDPNGYVNDFGIIHYQKFKSYSEGLPDTQYKIRINDEPIWNYVKVKGVQLMHRTERLSIEYPGIRNADWHYFKLGEVEDVLDDDEVRRFASALLVLGVSKENIEMDA